MGSSPSLRESLWLGETIRHHARQSRNPDPTNTAILKAISAVVGWIWLENERQASAHHGASYCSRCCGYSDTVHGLWIESPRSDTDPDSFPPERLLLAVFVATAADCQRRIVCGCLSYLQSSISSKERFLFFFCLAHWFNGNYVTTNFLLSKSL